MSRRYLFVLAVVLLSMTAVATGAVVLTEGDESDRVADDVIAYPDPGPNGVYASFDANDEIVVDFTQENPDLEGDGVPSAALTGIDDVFRLEYAGDEHAEVWLETDERELEFYTDEGPVDGEDNATTLGPDESVAIGFAVDGTDLEPGDRLQGTFEINAAVADPDESVADFGRCVPASIEVGSPDEVTRSVAVTDVQTCEPETVSVRSLPIGDHVSLESVDVTFATRTDVAFEVVTPYKDAEQKESTFTSAESLRAETGAVPIGSYAVTDPPDDDAVESMTHVVRVDRPWLEREPFDLENVSIYRHDGETWTEADRELVSETDEAVAFAAPASGGSLYAVAVDGSALPADDGQLDVGTEPALGEAPDRNAPSRDLPNDDGGETGELAGALSGFGFETIGVVGFGTVVGVALLWRRFARS